ncbi:cobyric acid synthase, partial [Verrucomicrobiota bacterium]
LKPMGEKGSQVIVNGKPIGNFPAKDYYKMKDSVKQSAFKAYDRISKKYDLIILEGAGSPAEINLMEEDFVNMAMAEYAGAGVVLVADIDRGGVFASIYGTVSLLPEKYRKLIKGIIINKFRGDQDLLESGIKQIERLTGIPVLGVLPFIRNLRIEEEDSLGLDGRSEEQDAILDIAVIRLPHISNYTDFMVFENTNGVSLRYIAEADEAGSPDMFIIPGTKNTRADLQFLHESGWSDRLTEAVSRKIPVIGICGGYQMLGSRVVDPSGVEGEKGCDIGLNLLPVTTVLEPRKELAQVEGLTTKEFIFAKPGTSFKGYEIHAGRTTATISDDHFLIVKQRLGEKVEGKAGSISENGLVFGCYIHGFFDAQSLRCQLLDWLCKRKDIKPLNWDLEDSEAEFDRLADIMEEKLELASIAS